MLIIPPQKVAEEQLAAEYNSVLPWNTPWYTVFCVVLSTMQSTGL